MAESIWRYADRPFAIVTIETYGWPGRLLPMPPPLQAPHQQPVGFWDTYRQNRRLIWINNIVLTLLLLPAVACVVSFSVGRSQSAQTSTTQATQATTTTTTTTTQPADSSNTETIWIHEVANTTKPFPLSDQFEALFQSLTSIVENAYIVHQSPCQTHHLLSSSASSNSKSEQDEECRDAPLYNGTLYASAVQVVDAIYRDIADQADRHVRAYSTLHPDNAPGYRDAVTAFRHQWAHITSFQDPWVARYVGRLHLLGWHPALLLLADGSVGDDNSYPNLAPQGFAAMHEAWDTTFSGGGGQPVDHDDVEDNEEWNQDGKSLSATSTDVASLHALWARRLAIALGSSMHPQDQQDPHEGIYRPTLLLWGDEEEGGGDGDDYGTWESETYMVEPEDDGEDNDSDNDGDYQDSRWNKAYRQFFQPPSSLRDEAPRAWDRWVLRIIIQVYFDRLETTSQAGEPPQWDPEQTPMELRRLLIAANHTAAGLRAQEAGLRRFEDLTLMWFAAQDILDATEQQQQQQKQGEEASWWRRNPFWSHTSSTAPPPPPVIAGKTRSRHQWDELHRLRLHTGLAVGLTERLMIQIQALVIQWQNLGKKLIAIMDSDMRLAHKDILSIVDGATTKTITVLETTTEYTLEPIPNLAAMFLSLADALSDFEKTFTEQMELLESRFPVPEW